MVPPEGVHLRSRLPDGRRDLEVTQRPGAGDVLTIPGCDTSPAETSGGYLRLGFAATEAERVEKTAAAILGVPRG